MVNIFLFALLFCYAKKAMLNQVLQVECVFNFHVLLIEKKHPVEANGVPKVMQIIIRWFSQWAGNTRPKPGRSSQARYTTPFLPLAGRISA
jgi:hypothetical protein